MKFYTQKIYWAVQLSWWMFATFILRNPTTKFFKDPQILYSYLIISFLAGIILSNFYATLFQEKFRNNKKTLLFAITGVVLTGVFFFLIDFYYGFQRYRKPSEGLSLETYDYVQFLVESFRFTGLWFLFYHLWISNYESHYKAVALAQSETALKSAELANLKNQLNPHFLFNAINSIKALTITDPNLARNALTQLSELLRTSLTIGSEQLVSLESEISFVKDYLFLEKIRYENRLNYTFEIDKNTLNVKIPPMSLQLLVENAIKHGISKSKVGGVIKVRSELNHNRFSLEVINTGRLSTKESSTGVGLKNLEKRLFLTYRENANYSITENNNFVIASINILND